MKKGERVYNPEYGYGTVAKDGELRVQVQWDDGSEGGAEVKQLILEKQANGMEKETMSGKQPKHESEPMEMESLMGDQYRITCQKCGQKLIIPRHQRENGSADCTGEWIYLAWSP